MSLNLILTVSLFVLPRILPGGGEEIVQIGGGEERSGGVEVAHEVAPEIALHIPPSFLWKERGAAEWEPEVGDVLLIDVERNIGTLLHQNGESLSFPVITGQQKTVRYIGLRYFAGTPEKTWTARLLDIQGDRITYGPTGKFLRLFDESGRTHYGIHAHRDETVMFGREDRYQSMGCIIVQRPILDRLIATFELNGRKLLVRTFGEDEPMIASASVQREG